VGWGNLVTESQPTFPAQRAGGADAKRTTSQPKVYTNVTNPRERTTCTQPPPKKHLYTHAHTYLSGEGFFQRTSLFSSFFLKELQEETVGGYWIHTFK